VKAELQKFDGGKSLMAGAGGIGVVGLLATLGGIAMDPRPAMFSYLWAFAYWAVVTQGAPTSPKRSSGQGMIAKSALGGWARRTGSISCAPAPICV